MYDILLYQHSLLHCTYTYTLCTVVTCPYFCTSDGGGARPCERGASLRASLQQQQQTHKHDNKLLQLFIILIIITIIMICYTIVLYNDITTLPGQPSDSDRRARFRLRTPSLSPSSSSRIASCLTRIRHVADLGIDKTPI